MAVIDELIIIENGESKIVDSAENGIIDEIEVDNNFYHFAKQNEVYSVCDNAVEEPIIDLKISGNSVQSGTPTPETPVEVESVGDYDEETGKYKIPVNISGKNLVDVNALADMNNCIVSKYGDAVEYYFNNLTVGKTYTVYFKYEKDIPTNGVINISNNGVVVVNFKYKEGTATFKATNNVKIRGYIPEINSCVNAFKEFPETLTIMIEEGDTATEYQPYFNKTTNIYIKEPLRKLGNYADYIDYKNKKVFRKIKQYQINSNSDFGKFGGVTNYSAFYLNKRDLVTYEENNKSMNVPIMSKTFSYRACGGANVNGSWTGDYQIGGSLYTTYKRICFTLPNNIVDTTSAKEWLENNPIDYLYPSIEIIEETIDIPEISTSKGSNNFKTETTIQPSELKINYWKQIGVVEAEEEITQSGSDILIIKTGADITQSGSNLTIGE